MVVLIQKMFFSTSVRSQKADSAEGPRIWLVAKRVWTSRRTVDGNRQPHLRLALEDGGKSAKADKFDWLTRQFQQQRLSICHQPPFPKGVSQNRATKSFNNAGHFWDSPGLLVCIMCKILRDVLSPKTATVRIQQFFSGAIIDIPALEMSTLWLRQLRKRRWTVEDREV